MTGRTFAAHYRLTCADCGQPIEPGQLVHYGDKYYTHVTCPTTERSDKP